MKIREFIKKGLRKHLFVEEQLDNKVICYHGSRTILPFKEFDEKMIGTGLVSNGTKYGGFFFTTEKENAEYYTEYFICKVIIDNIKPSPEKKPTSALSLALKTKENYIIEDILDGSVFSNIIVVPKNNLSTIKIVGWEFVGDEEYIFEKWDEMFGDDSGFTNQDMINEVLEMIEVDINYLMGIPIFSEYYNSKK